MIELLAAAMLSPAVPARTVPVRRSALTNAPGIELVADLPPDSAFAGYGPDGRPLDLDLGYSYRELSVLWMPIWAEGDGGLVLYSGSGATLAIAPAGETELARIKAVTGIDYAATYRFPLARHLWGWLPILGVIGSILLVQWRGAKRCEALGIV
ncbi:MAG: hypothetical protein H0X36_00605 [Sphingomonadaceae bacterium]|nr:hypothetical protein [Sphingomonadaceae bacterium]